MMKPAEFAPTTQDATSSNNIDNDDSPPINRYDSGIPSLPMEQESWELPDARPLLPSAAFFMGDLRDGLPMLNMQAAFLISAKGFSEKEVGVLFFVFGMSQFLCMAPAGYLMDYSNHKIDWVIWSGFITSALTVITVLTAGQAGENMELMILLKILQGSVTAILPPGFNGITLGIVGSTGFTHQVSRNRMMNHIGTALIVAIGSLVAYCLYPNIGVLFMVSPIAAIGVYYNLIRIKPKHVNTDAARGLIIESPTMNEYEQMDENASVQNAGSIWQSMDEFDDEGNQDTSSTGGGERVDDVYQYPRQPQNNFNSSYVAPDTARWNPAASSFAPPPNMGDFPNRRTEASSQRTPSDLISEVAMPPGFLPANHQRQVSEHIHRPPRHGDDQHDMERDMSNSTQRSNVRSYGSEPSFNFGWSARRMEARETKDADANAELEKEEAKPRRAMTPFSVLLDPTLVTFSFVVFSFHLANSSVLPLVMQSLALEDAQAGILLSGLCILIAQGFMSYFAKVCGDYTPKWGRKNLMLFGLASLTLRCFLLTVLLTAQENAETRQEVQIIKALILSTQFLDSIGAGVFGTLHILVTNDISGVSGRFSLLLGVTTGAMCLGGTVSGYIGQAIAQDYGYPLAFASLGVMSLIPFFLYLFCMPETLPDYVKPKNRRRRLIGLLKKLNEHRRKLSATNPFRAGRIIGLGEVNDMSGMMNERLRTPSELEHRMASSQSHRSFTSRTKLPSATVELV